MNNDSKLLAEAYQKVLEQDSILIPRRSKEERQKNYQIALQKQVQEYIKNGSKEDLDLENTSIQSLPDNLRVGGSLDLSGTPIQSLSDNLRVGESLYLQNTPIQSLPDNLRVGGNLDLSNTLIKHLPDNLRVGGNLWLYKTPISKKYTKKQLKQMLKGVKGGIYV